MVTRSNAHLFINDTTDAGSATVTSINPNADQTITLVATYNDPALYSNPQLQIINSPGGNNSQIQFNNGKGFGGDSNLTYTASTQMLSLLGNLRVVGNIVGNISATPTNFKLAGGNATNLLSTDGTGNLLWVSAPAGTGGPNLANYATTAFVTGAIANIAIPNISNLATQTFVTNSIANISIPNVSNLATQTFVTNSIANISVPNISGLASETFVSNAIANIATPSVEGLATETYVNDAVTALVAGAPTELNTLKKLADAVQLLLSTQTDGGNANLTFTTTIDGGNA
jgi:hypothetical protein